MKRKVVRIYSDDFQGDLLSIEAYRELRLHMSTGDFHTHKFEYVDVANYPGVFVYEIEHLKDIN